MNPASIKMSVAEYLIADEKADRPSEYHDGEVFQIADATLNHAALVGNVTRRTMEKLDGSPCRVFVTPRATKLLRTPR